MSNLKQLKLDTNLQLLRLTNSVHLNDVQRRYVRQKAIAIRRQISELVFSLETIEASEIKWKRQ